MSQQSFTRASSNKKWFTSDLHFQHRNIVKFTDRGIVTTQEDHDEWLIDLWNSTVKKGDLVYHLGDFSFAKGYDSVKNIVQRLNGQIIMIKGNHDREEHLKRLKLEGMIAKYSMYEEIKIAGNPTVLFHFPISSWHRQSHGAWHLHGHTHGNLKSDRSIGKMLDVGIDNAYNVTGKHQFFDEDMITDYMSKREFYISDIHREDRYNSGENH
jgi:calcineurin-like phosphoesterase family protein